MGRIQNLKLVFQRHQPQGAHTKAFQFTSDNSSR